MDDSRDKAPEPHRNGGLPPVDATKASATLGQPEADEHSEGEHPADPAVSPPRNLGGTASGLQPGGTIPGKSPGASVGSIGTGGGSTGGKATGAVKRGL